jgi:hypothetical protein
VVSRNLGELGHRFFPFLLNHLTGLAWRPGMARRPEFWSFNGRAHVESVLPSIFMPAMPRQLRQESSIHLSVAKTDSPLNDNKSARSGHASTRRRVDRK